MLLSRELADLQKANAVTQSAAETAAATAEKTRQEEIKVKLEQGKAAFQKEKEILILQVCAGDVSVASFGFWVDFQGEACF